MTTLTSTLTSPAPASGVVGPRSSGKWLGALLIAEGLLSLAPMAVLGPAIGWPASLDNPAAQQLAAIHAQPDAVAWGYGIYLLYSLLVAPVMIWLAARLFGGLQHPLAATVAAFAALSTLARCIGILRWLTVMPALAAAHAGADPATRVHIERLFDALNAYGGGIGELLGVGLFMGAAMALLAFGALRARLLPTALGVWAGVSALLLVAMLLPALRLADEPSVAIVVSVLSFWMMAVGAWLMVARRS
jgi:hypothetical protein